MHSAAYAPIGVFDSGLGGLSVLKAIRTALPNERLMYVADSAHAPYGERDANFVINRTLAVSNFLLQANVKCIVVACNTATALAIETLRQHCTVPVIAIEPAVKPAVAVSKNKVIGVLATRATIASTAFTQLCERYRGDTQLILQPCPGLVEQVEKGELDSAATKELLLRYMQPLLDAGADTLVLGCTHYPFLLQAIRALAGEAVQIMEPSAAVARELANRLQRHRLIAENGNEPDHGKAISQAMNQKMNQKMSQEKTATTVREQFFTNTNLVKAQQLIAALWGNSVQVQAL